MYNPSIREDEIGLIVSLASGAAGFNIKNSLGFMGMFQSAIPEDRIYTLPNCAGIMAMQTGAFTEGSIPFTDSAGTLDQDNANLFWNNTAKRLGILTATPNAALDVRGAAIFNENGGNNDFRVESQNDINCLFVDASRNSVGIGTSAPAIIGSSSFDRVLHIAVSGDEIPAVGFSRSGGSGFTNGAWSILLSETGNLTVQDSQVTPKDILKIEPATFANSVIIGASTIVFNEGGDNLDLRIEGDNEINLFFVDASEDRIGIGKNDPAFEVDIVGSVRFTGQLRAAAGSAALPSITFDGNDNTGFFNSSGNVIGVSSAGVLVGRFFQFGDFFIDSLDRNLHLRPVRLTSGAGNDLRLRGGEGSGTDQAGGDVDIRSGKPTGSGVAGDVTIKNAAGSQTNVTFKDGGKVGFGTVAPNEQLNLTDVMQIDERVGNPGGTGNAGKIYTKDVAGVTQLFYQRSNGTVVQVT